jgi:hypothetical protein
MTCQRSKMSLLKLMIRLRPQILLVYTSTASDNAVMAEEERITVIRVRNMADSASATKEHCLRAEAEPSIHCARTATDNRPLICNKIGLEL